MMELLWFLVKGFVMGLAVAAPIGPVGTLCIKKTLQLGTKGGLAVMVGGSVSNALWAILVGVGLALLESLTQGLMPYWHAGGGLFLFYLGVTDIFSKTTTIKDTLVVPTKELWGIMAKTTLIGISSPMAIIIFMSLYASVAGDNLSTHEALMVSLGVLLASITWFTFLTHVVATANKKLPASFIRYVCLASGIALLIFGVFALWGGMADLLGWLTPEQLWDKFFSTP